MNSGDTTLKRLQVILTGNSTQLQSALKQAEQATNTSTTKIEKGLSKVDSALKKVGKAALAYISVKSIVNFSKACIDLGSELSEVQNVVDVTFGNLSGKIDKFARGAAKSFGLSETAAKKYSSTMGAMLKSMGMSTEKAYTMSTNLAGLAGDIASFYNLSTDEAFSKLRSGISGETEPLKQLGINLSVANLQAYALSKGITKSYNAMTQAEQATLRYNYLLETTKDAQGDFARTSGSWANQTKILSMQFDSLKASLGQGFIMALTPVIQLINKLMEKLVALGEAFKNLMAELTGTDLTAEAGSTAAAFADAQEAAEGVGDALSDGIKDAEKATKRFLMSFDEIHKVEGEESVDTSAIEALTDPMTINGMESLNEATSAENESLSKMHEWLDKIKVRMQPVIDKGKELGHSFLGGFTSTFNIDGLKQKVDETVDHLKGSKDSVLEIFGDPELQQSAESFLNTAVETFGKFVGSVASVITTIISNVTGGIEKFLSENKDRIKKHLGEMFNINGQTLGTFGDLVGSISRIFEPFGEEDGQQLTANVTGIFASAFMHVKEQAAKLFRDILGIFAKPITMNTEKIRKAFKDILKLARQITGTFKTAIDWIGDKWSKLYDEHLKPLFDSIGDGLGKALGKFLDVWNEKIKPTLDEWGEKIQQLWDQHLKPFFDELGNALGDVFDALKVLWDNILQPLIEFISGVVVSAVWPVVKSVIDTAITLIGDIIDALKGVFEVLGGLIEFLVGVFTLDWDKAWNGIKRVVTGLWDVIKAIGIGIADVFKGIWDLLCGFFDGLGDLFQGAFEAVVNWVSRLFGGGDVYGVDRSYSSNPNYWDTDGGMTLDGFQDSTYTLADAEANGQLIYDAVYNAIQDTQTSEESRDIYLDGEQIGQILNNASFVRNTRVNPQFGY